MSADNPAQVVEGGPHDSRQPTGRKPIPLDAFGGAAVPQGLKNSAGMVVGMLILIAGLLVVVQVIGILGGVGIAIFMALIVAALGGPVQRLFCKAMPSALATVFTMLLMALAVAAVLAFVAKSIVGEWDALQTAVQAGFQQIQEWLKTGPLHMDDASVNALIDSAQKWASGEGVSAAKSLPGVLGSFGDFITVASVFMFASFFFLHSGAKIWAWIVGWIPSRIRVESDDCGAAAWQALSGYTRGIILVAIADGLLVFVGLVILQVPLAAALAVVVMFGALIPVIGAPIATLLAAVVALATEGLTTALLVVALTIVVGSFDGDIMQPLIMGHAVQLHPLAIVSVIALGTLSFGIVGALVAVPLTGTVYSIAKYLTGRMPAPRDMPKARRKPQIPKFFRRRKSTPAPAG